MVWPLRSLNCSNVSTKSGAEPLMKTRMCRHASFVNVGSAVRPDSTVCVIEAMKVFTDIPAGVTGTVTEVLVKNGQPVEFGQPLFRVRPA